MGVALITPFKSDKTIDFEALRKVIGHVLDGKVDYIVVLGTTGEAATLNESERKAVMDFVAKEVAGKVPLVLGLGSNCTQNLVEELSAAEFEGYDAILSVAPFYNKPSQEGIYRHFATVAESSPLPVVLYNVPGRTGINISTDTTLRLASEFENVIGIKEASGNFKQIEKIILGKPDAFQVISGDDGLTYPLMALGAEGVISVVANAYPEEFGKMVRLCLEGNLMEARPIHRKFSRLYEDLFVDGNPAGMKSLLHSMGLIENELRLPLVPTRKETDDSLRSIMMELQS